MELQELRQEIDSIDHEITRLFDKRMSACEEVAAYKRAHALPVFDAGREREKLSDVAEGVRPEYSDAVRALYTTIFEQSRSRQRALNRGESALHREITHAIEHTPALFPESAAVACQGVEGAYSQLACSRLFKSAHIMYFGNFESVFSAIESGLCSYGVLPLENSSAGSVNKIYDLMQRHNFRIVRSLRLKVDHNLLAVPGSAIGDIREIFTHEQALAQCAGYLEKMNGVKVTRCENTAIAAQIVAQSGRRDVAAIASRACAEIYGLNVLEGDIQDHGNNYTRFICISRNAEIYPGANRTSVMMTLPHRPGALCEALMRIQALGVNISKLESRPIPERDFDFMFYFDLDLSVYSESFPRLIDDLNDLSEQFRYLGSYLEVV